MKLYTPAKFKEMTEQACKCDENGMKYDQKGSFYQNEDGSERKDSVEMLLKESVFQTLKLKGNLRSLIYSEYFIGPNRSNEF